MAAVANLPLPRLPQALARYQESLPLPPYKPPLQSEVLAVVIPLRVMCCKYWLERVQYILRRDLPKPQIFAVQRYLCQLPRELRTFMVHNALKAGGLHLAHGTKELTAVNRALVFLTPEVPVYEPVYLTIPRPNPNGIDWPPDVELLLRNGDSLTTLVISLPLFFSDTIRKLLNDLCRTCRRLTSVEMHQATDEAVTLLTRHCQNLVSLNVQGSAGVTDEGVDRIVVNLRWTEKEATLISHIDVGRTSVTQEGLVTLLTRLPSLTSLGSSDVVDVLNAMEEVLGSEASPTPLEEATVKCVTVNRLQTLRRLCPALNAIRATFQEHGTPLNSLKLIPDLTHIRLTVQEPFLLSPANLYDLAWDIGPRLQTLSLAGDVYWEADLALLVAHCPNLKELSLPAVTFPNRESLSVLLQKDTPVFNSLQVLEIDCMTGAGPKAWAKDFALARYGLVICLRLCRQLHKLLLRPTTLVDSDFRDVLAVNRMESLQVLELYNSAMGLTTAKLLVDTCTQLHVMKGVRTWRGLTLHDLVQLRQHSRGHHRAAELKVLP